MTFLMTARKKEKKKKPASPEPGPQRSELNGEVKAETQMRQWLLWAGISPEANQPVSHIGIYTDFT